VAEIKLTKNELRAQQVQLAQLEKYLPTLQLKKAMLQAEVQGVRLEIEQLEESYSQAYGQLEPSLPLLTEKVAIDPQEITKIDQVQKHYENIAGVEVPYFEGITFAKLTYHLFDTPVWVDDMVLGLRSLAEMRMQVAIAQEKKEALNKELREVSIRVNLFEKILIPRALKNIKKIKIFLGDQELSAVSQAKVAKTKIELNKELRRQRLEMSHAD